MLSDTFAPSSEAVEIAKAWRPEFSRSPTPLDVVVTTNENYADLLVRQYSGALAATKKDGKVEVGSVSKVPAQRFASWSRAPTEFGCSRQNTSNPISPTG